MSLDEHHISESEDIDRRGIIGNYVHGNEPSHHVPYLYSYSGAPEKTQERVRMIMDQLYDTGPDGLPGNDDCGQMSAWYIFSALGFYPVCPGSTEYVLGSPAVEEAVLNLENGNIFTIKVKNQKPRNVYVKSVTLNGEPYSNLFITHEDIINGGELVVEMAGKPRVRDIPSSALPGRF